LSDVRKEAYSDGKLTVDEFRKITEKAAEDGVTKEEKSLVSNDMAKAMKDNPDSASKAEITLIAQMVLSNTEILKKVIYLVLTFVIVYVFTIALTNGQLTAIIAALLSALGLG